MHMIAQRKLVKSSWVRVDKLLTSWWWISLLHCGVRPTSRDGNSATGFEWMTIGKTVPSGMDCDHGNVHSLILSQISLVFHGLDSTTSPWVTRSPHYVTLAFIALCLFHQWTLYRRLLLPAAAAAATDIEQFRITIAVTSFCRSMNGRHGLTENGERTNGG